MKYDSVSKRNYLNGDPTPELVKRSRPLHKSQIRNRKRHINQASLTVFRRWPTKGSREIPRKGLTAASTDIY